MNTSDDAELTLSRTEVDDKLEGVFAGIVRETFAAEERVHLCGWDRIPTTVVQYLRREDVPSSVWVQPIGLAQLGKPMEAVAFLLRAILSDEPGARQLREKFIKPEAEDYLACAIAVEGYLYPDPAKHKRRQRGDTPLAHVPDALEIRTLSGITVDNRRFVVMRARGDEDAVTAKVDFAAGEDPSCPGPEFEQLLVGLNAAFQQAYMQRP